MWFHKLQRKKRFKKEGVVGSVKCCFEVKQNADKEYSRSVPCGTGKMYVQERASGGVNGAC